MWRDIAITNKANIAEVLLKLEQRLAHIRENLDSRELAAEFERAHELKKEKPAKTFSPQRHRVPEKGKR
jgi:prephenate dehydrogenase